MANGDTPAINFKVEQKAVGETHTGPSDIPHAAVKHSLFNDAYNFIADHKKEAEIAAGAALATGATLALRHYLPASIAEKVSATGASILERTVGSTPNAVRELKVLDAPEKVESLVARLRNNETTSGLLKVADPQSGERFNLLAGHSPISPESAAKADRIATCDLPAGCESKALFATQKGPLFFKYDSAHQTFRFSTTSGSFTERVTQFLRGDREAWMPLGTQPSPELRSIATDRSQLSRLESATTNGARTSNRNTEIVSKWESQQRLINKNADKQDAAANLIRDEILPELQRSGKISRDWKFVSTAVHSASDQAGADGIFVNQVTGDAHLIDFSTNPMKRVRPAGEAEGVRRAGITERTELDDAEFAEGRADGFRDKKIPAVRTQGLMGFDRIWFDEMGKLDVDLPEAAAFRKQLGEHLTDLTTSQAYFNASKTPFADIALTAPESQVKQLETLKQWAIQEARKPDSLHPTGYREYADSVHKAMDYIKSTYVARGDSTHFGTVIHDQAEQTIFRWAVDRVGPQVTTEGRTAARSLTTPFSAAHKGDSNLSYVKEKSIFSFSDGDLKYSSGVMTGVDGVLDKSRKALMQEGRIKELFNHLGERQKTNILARLGTPARPATEERAIREINSVLINEGNTIRAGGQVGQPRPGSVPVLIERLQQRLEVHNVNTLTRPVDIPGAADRLAPKKMPRMQ